MALQAMWVHGNVAIPEFIGTRGILDSSIQGLVKVRYDSSVGTLGTERPLGSEIDGSELVGHRGAKGAAFRGQASKVMHFHFPIPSPVYRSSGDAPGPDPDRARLNRVFLLFDSQPGVILNQLLVFDGQRLIYDQLLREMTGPFGNDITWGNPPDNSNVWMLPSPDGFGPAIAFGITISVFAQFSADESQNQIVFRSAGADFLV